MRIVALLAVRNEALYLARCLDHLHAQGIETCLIDNESTDETRAIAERRLGRGVLRIETYPYAGVYDWLGILRRKEELAGEIGADWFIHHDADEIREAPARFRTLREGVAAADAAGYNALNFDEYVFLPTSAEESAEGTDYVAAMRHYYFFEPRPMRRVNAWKNCNRSIDLRTSGGHNAAFDGQRVLPENFVLRHYMILSARHGLRKYGSERVYSSHEVETLKWHGARARFAPEKLSLPPRTRLKCVDVHGWDKSDPWKKHTFLG